MHTGQKRFLLLLCCSILTMPPRKRKAQDDGNDSGAKRSADSAPPAPAPAPQAPAPPALPPAVVVVDNAADPAPPTATFEGRVVFNKLQKGDILSRHCYYVVESVNQATDTIIVKNLDNNSPSITICGRQIPEKEMFSASQFERVEKVTRTEMVCTMEKAKDTVFTVEFDKQATEKDALTAVNEMITAQPPLTDREKRKRIRENVLHGEPRTMVAHLLDVEDHMGRSRVVDLQIPLAAGCRERQVDHRSVKSLVLRGVKYEQK